MSAKRRLEGKSSTVDLPALAYGTRTSEGSEGEAASSTPPPAPVSLLGASSPVDDDVSSQSRSEADTDHNELLALRSRVAILEEKNSRHSGELEMLREEYAKQVAAVREVALRDKDEQRREYAALLAELDQMNKINAQLESVLEKTATRESDLRVAADAAATTMTLMARNIDRITLAAASIQREALPSFRGEDVELPLLCELEAPAGGVADHGLLKSAKECGAVLSLLKMTFEAKLEGAGLVRKQLKDSNARLQTELEKAREAIRKEAAAVARTEDAFNEERLRLREELKQLEKLYVAELTRARATNEELRTTLKTRDAQLAATQNAAEKVAADRRNLESRVAGIQAELARNENARAQLAATLSDRAREMAALHLEIDGLKMVQKFLPSRRGQGGEEAAGVEPRQLDLMKLTEQLQREVTELREQNEAAEAEVKRLRRQERQQRFDRTLTLTEVEMAAADKVNDHELVSKILRRNMAERLSGSGPRARTPSPDRELVVSPTASLFMRQKKGKSSGEDDAASEM